MNKTLLEPSKELLRECRAGNQLAFKEIFHMYRSYAYNLIYKTTGAHGDHEDLLQEVFFQIYLSLKTFQGDSSFKTWFHRVVIHVCTRRWRYQQAEKRISKKDTVNLDSIENMVPSMDCGSLRKLELKDLVEQALDTLDYKLRIPIVLNIYGEMDLAEIATIMGIPEGTVKSRLFTARKQIKEFLDGLDN
ncbi:RNA polymerase sigma factor [Chitinispirillales bacterium ANBcel5]|uniref:RNA polymerase sigma factor n=1 Tax=Cellulosispirillum alkaliphilum TaxID=3039283 RepID=UPI002A593424|nr:RNA polymerase sigma factor [Chitinispirillales bacterium ANBcel5]